MPQHHSQDTNVEASALLLTVPEACVLLRVSRWSLCRLIQRNELTTIKIGSRRLVPRTAVEEFVRSRAEEAFS